MPFSSVLAFLFYSPSARRSRSHPNIRNAPRIGCSDFVFKEAREFDVRRSAALGAISSFRRSRFFTNAQPGALDVPRFGGGLANAEAERELVVQFGVREVEVAVLIEAFHDGLIDSVAGAMAKAHKIQRHWRGEFELTIVLAIVAHPGCELLREFDVAADVMLQTFDAVVANHKP